MRLDERLENIVGMCDNSVTIADIGADHGFTSYALIKRKICERVIVSDISAESLSKAVSLFKDYSISSFADFRVGNGFDVLKPGDAQGAIISGMGGTTILNILADSIEVSKSLDWIIISPQSNPETVREELLKKGFSILSERYCRVNQFFYPIMKIRYTGQVCSCSEEELYTGINGAVERNETARDFYTYMVDKYNRVIPTVNNEKKQDEMRKIRLFFEDALKNV